MKEKIEFFIFGTVSGFKEENETKQEAIGRLGINAELFGNNGIARIHINEVHLPEEFEVDKFSDYLIKKLRIEDPSYTNEISFKSGFDRAYHWMLKNLYAVLPINQLEKQRDEEYLREEQEYELHNG